MATRLALEERTRLETLLKLPFSGFMDNLSMTNKLPRIAKLLEINQSTIYREVIVCGFDYEKVIIPGTECRYGYNMARLVSFTWPIASELNAHITLMIHILLSTWKL